MVMKLYANIDNKIWVAKPMLNSVAGVVLVENNDATMARIANGNKQRNKFSRGLRILLIITKDEIEKAIKVDISKNQN